MTVNIEIQTEHSGLSAHPDRPGRVTVHHDGRVKFRVKAEIMGVTGAPRSTGDFMWTPI